MNSIEIKEVRKKQFLSINLFSILFFVIVGSIIYLFEASRLTVFLLLIVFMVISFFFTWREMDGKEWRRSAWARALVVYEKEKLGEEWYKLKRSELTSKLIIIALFVFQLVIGNAREPFMPADIGVQYWISLSLVIILLSNAGLFFRNRKIDC